MIMYHGKALPVLPGDVGADLACLPMTGLAREAAALTKLSLLHVWGDPLKYRDLEAKIAVERFNCAIVLCDGAWVDPDQVGFLGGLAPSWSGFTTSGAAVYPAATLAAMACVMLHTCCRCHRC